MNENSEVTLNYHSLPPIAEQGRTQPFSRVLTLLPGPAGASLTCTIELFEVENPRLPYEALSYIRFIKLIR